METNFDLLREKINVIEKYAREIKDEFDKNEIQYDCTDICEILLSSNNLKKGVKRHERRIIRKRNKRRTI